MFLCFRFWCLSLSLTCGSSTAPWRRQTPGSPFPRTPRWPGRTAALSTWSGSARCSSCPRWETQRRRKQSLFVWFGSKTVLNFMLWQVYITWLLKEYHYFWQKLRSRCITEGWCDFCDQTNKQTSLQHHKLLDDIAFGSEFNNLQTACKFLLKGGRPTQRENPCKIKAE